MALPGDVLDELEEKYPHLKVVTVTEHDRKFKTGKKFALTLGIKAAKHDCLLFTDADCVPASEHWVALLWRPTLPGQTKLYWVIRHIIEKTRNFLNSLLSGSKL
jgi:biofilm PGA synthesis N-glycosyltransferase PgaC